MIKPLDRISSLVDRYPVRQMRIWNRQHLGQSGGFRGNTLPRLIILSINCLFY
jgi:hypothetical protein